MFLLSSCAGFAQTGAIDSSYNNWYYQQRMDFYEALEVKKHDVVFLGNSITEKGEWHEMLPKKVVANRGIGGDNTFGVLARVEQIIALRPEKLFILIGINDLGRGLPVDVIAKNYAKLVDKIRQALPGTLVYVQSVLPLNEDILKYAYLQNKTELVRELNLRIEQIGNQENVTYVDLHELFAGEDGQLKAAWSLDGIHLKPVAYSYWVNFLKKRNFL